MHNRSIAYSSLGAAVILLLILIFAVGVPSTGNAGVSSETAGPGLQVANNTADSLILPGKLGILVDKTPRGIEKGMIDPDAEKGFAGIPGAPLINYFTAFLWAVWIGWIFSTVGAFGGIMAGVGHLTILGLGAYAGSFRITNPELNAFLTDTIRASNQYLVGLAAFISTVNFYRAKRIVLPLGLALGAGSVAGGVLIPLFTAGKIQLGEYLGYFGLTVLVIGGFIYYSTTRKGLDSKKKAGEATESFKRMLEEKRPLSSGVEGVSFGLTAASFSFYGTEYRFNPLLAFAGGLLIAALSSFIGIGGGFLYVPFLTMVVGLPMLIVAGTSALAVLLGMVTSIFSFVVLKETFISWDLVGVEMAGVCIGAMIGPRTQKYIPEVWLKRLFVLLAVYVGLRYFSKGFFGQSWLPPY